MYMGSEREDNRSFITEVMHIHDAVIRRWYIFISNVDVQIYQCLVLCLQLSRCYRVLKKETPMPTRHLDPTSTATTRGHDCAQGPHLGTRSDLLLDTSELQLGTRRPSSSRHSTASGVRSTGPGDHNRAALLQERRGGIGDQYSGIND